MSIPDRREVIDLNQAIGRVVDASALEPALQALRRLFVERLDFNRATDLIQVRADGLRTDAQRLAHRDGVHVVAVALPDGGNITAARVRTVLNELRRTLAGDLLLVATNQRRSEWHFVYPTDMAGREVLRRMVVRQGEPSRTVVEQLAGVYTAMERGGDLRRALEDAYNVEAVTKKFLCLQPGIRGSSTSR